MVVSEEIGEITRLVLLTIVYALHWIHKIQDGRLQLHTCRHRFKFIHTIQVQWTQTRFKLHTRGSRQKRKKDTTPRCSRVVPHPSTERAQRTLTSEFGWDPVHCTWYGRIRGEWWNYKISIINYCLLRIALHTQDSRDSSWIATIT